MFRVAVFRSSAIVSYFGIEKLTSALVSPATWTLTTGGGTAVVYGFFHNVAGVNTVGGPGATVSGSQGGAGYLGAVARVHTNADNTITVQGGGESVGLATGQVFPVEKPELQGATGELMFPLQKYSLTTNASGKLGTLIDWWYVITSSLTTTPALADTYGTLQYVALGPAAIWPWDGSTTPVIA
jgi:hypothetical protein